MHLDPIFRARSVALIGLSSDSSKMTGVPLQILQRTGFAGRIFPVNPKTAEIGGVRCYPSIEALPEATDVAMLLLPAAACADAVRRCVAKGIRSFVVPSSGFEETEGGTASANNLRAVAHEYDVPVVGPNCEGLWSVGSRVLLTFGSAAKRDVLHHAPIAVISQSGAMGGAMARHLQDEGVGCAYMVSVGNETVLTIADYLEWMIEQDDVRVVALFMEGLRDGARLVQVIEKAVSRGIRVVALKCGNSEAGAVAAASHTGKMASTFAVYKDLLGAAGAILVSSLTELVAAVQVLAIAPLPKRKGPDGGVAVFSIPGGTRAMTVDQFEEKGVPLATFARDTVAKLKSCLPDFGGVENPTDLTGQVLSKPALFEDSLRYIASDANAEALIVQVANRGPRDIMERIELLGQIAREHQFPVVATFLGDSLPLEERAALRRQQVLAARDPAEAASFLSWLYRARDAGGVYMSASTAKANCEPPTDWESTARWLVASGIRVPAWRALRADCNVDDEMKGITYPVAVKALPEHADHKTELGLLALNIPDAVGVEREAARIRSALRKPEAGVLVQEMVSKGVEVIVAGMVNPDFGPVLAVGSGGVATELFKDITWLKLPTTEQAARVAIGRLRLSKVLAGFRGAPPADIDALVTAIVRFGSNFAGCNPSLKEFELNPLIVGPVGKGVMAVDALVKA